MRTVIATVNLAGPHGGPALDAGVPVEVDETDETIRQFLDSGYLIDAPDQTGEVAPWVGGEPDDTWTNSQLRAHAEQHNIDVSGATTKAELLAAIGQQEG